MVASNDRDYKSLYGSGPWGRLIWEHRGREGVKSGDASTGVLMCHGKATCLVGSTLLQVAVPQPLLHGVSRSCSWYVFCLQVCWLESGHLLAEQVMEGPAVKLPFSASGGRGLGLCLLPCAQEVLVASLTLPWGSVCGSRTIRTSRSLRQAWASAASPALSPAWNLWRGTTPAWLAGGWKGACVGWGNGKQGQDGWWFWAPCHPDGPSGLSSCWNMLCPPLL